MYAIMYAYIFVLFMTKTITATQARKNFFQILREAVLPGNIIRVTLTDQQPVIIMSEEEYESWLETMEILSDPVQAKHLRQAIREHAAGTMETVPLEEVLTEYEA